ncbi:MAG: IS1 family transposase [Defluviitaleaceae bacterium]|nr:IS1 family transposase [Defluviitaleaceae bacterium]MCL2836716.1 IS1 family transposase [Defluviitaleaceae bacterium]
MPTCKKCNSERTKKNGIVSNKQRFKCKYCGCNFRLGDNRTNDKVAAKKALCILLYVMAKGSYRMLGRILKIDHTLVYRWIRAFGESLPEPEVSGEIKEIEFDEMWHFLISKKLWVIKAIDRSTERTVAWVLGGRDSTTFQRLYDKVKHPENCTFYTTGTPLRMYCHANGIKSAKSIQLTLNTITVTLVIIKDVLNEKRRSFRRRIL